MQIHQWKYDYINGKNTYSRLRGQLTTILFLFISLLYLPHQMQGQARDFDPPTRQRPSPSRDFKFDPDRLVFGGNLGASFGNITYVEIAPTVGYLMTDNYLLGLSGRYIYFEDRTYTPIYIYKTNIYGGGIFNQYFFLENFLAHAEYEVLNLDSPINFGKRINVHSVFVGGGYRSAFSSTSYFSLLLLYNLNDSVESPYSNPILRIGFGIGIN